ncbi:hypothetical protein Pcinc_014224 [Petrolisthes cinctipes]|uniref:Sorbitol dehydrogenase n=1 Tax=Petrolisthes cinctipes TaxID=88211 RepID=A0AAE1FXB7_PETCI|nr:hypothetical protein Pcinc_014224 [Petrolisthes cinctipes]
MENTFVELTGFNKLTVVKQLLPELKSNEVLTRMSKVGLCGTDLGMVYKGKLIDSPLTYPSGVGHEASGVVAKVGKDVTHLKPGDRVVMEPGNPCLACDMCYNSKYNVCDKATFHKDVVIYPGMLGKYYINKANFTYKLPDNVTDEEGAMMEPLAVAVHACRRAEIKFGCSVLITGAGPIGLLCLVAAKAMGATKIIVTDIKANRLVLAKKLGASNTLVVDSQGSQAKEDAKKVREELGLAPDITFECSGTTSGMTLALYATIPRGVVMVVGLLPAEITLPLGGALINELDIRGVYRFVDSFPLAIEMVAKGLVDINPLITHRFKFEEFQKAFDMFHTGQDGAIKCMISAPTS